MGYILHSKTLSSLLQIFHQELLRIPQKELFDSEYGISYMFEQWRSEDLTRIFKLYSNNASEGLDMIGTKLKSAAFK